jgi:hypothetical protein
MTGAAVDGWYLIRFACGMTIPAAFLTCGVRTGPGAVLPAAELPAVETTHRLAASEKEADGQGAEV